MVLSGAETGRYSENERLAALALYDILDTPRERELDDIVMIAAQICGVPTALISLIDDKRQWFKAAVGLDVTETPREIAFCARAIEQDDMLIVEDASSDARFADNPLVTGDTHLRFYAGAQLLTPDGIALGTICVLDTQARSISDDQRRALEALARQVMTQFEFRRLLAAKRADEERHRLIIATATDYAILTTDLAGTIDSWSEGATQMFGRTLAEALGSPCATLFTADDQAAGAPAAELRNARQNGRIFDERWHPRSDGELFWGRCEVMPLPDANGLPHGYLKIVQDRTAQRLADRALRESETRVRLALDSAELGAWEAIPATGEVYGDARARALLGYPGEDAVSFDDLLDGVYPEDRARFDAAVRAAVERDGAGLLDVEYRVGQVDAHSTWIRSRARVIKATGERHRLVGTVRDISAEKAAEEHRQLLANELQHRVKNTLAVVQGIVSQSLRAVTTPAEAREAITSRLATLAHAHDLLTQTSWTAAPIDAVIEGAVLAHCSEPGRVTVDGASVELKARAALALSMALHELFTNAVKYGSLSNETGTVRLSWIVSVDPGGGDDRFEFVWQEAGGPPVAPPSRTGFGTRLTGASLAADLGGAGRIAYDRSGVRWSLATTVDAVCE